MYCDHFFLLQAQSLTRYYGLFSCFNKTDIHIKYAGEGHRAKEKARRVLLEHEPLTLSSCHPFDADPPEREHGAVVVNVQKGDLAELFPQDEEHRVKVFDAFGDEIPPQCPCHLSGVQ